jgi:predicted dehydrogenase
VVSALTHYIDLLRWFLEGNEVVAVYACGAGMGRSDGVAESVYDVTWALLRCADGVVLNVGICYGLPAGYPSRGLSSRVELLGSEGVLLIDGDNTDEIMYTEHAVPHVHLANQDANMVFLGSATPGQWALGDFWGPLGTETRVWLDHQTTGRPCALATAEDALRSLRISKAIERSEYGGGVVRLSDVG